MKTGALAQGAPDLVTSLLIIIFAFELGSRHIPQGNDSSHGARSRRPGLLSLD